MGSEFSYEDLGSQDIEKFNFKFIADEPIKGGKAWRVERKSKKRSGYSKQIMIVHQEYLSPTVIEYYDRRGGLLKVAEFSDWKQMKVGKKSFWKSGYVHVKNIQTKKESIFKWEKRELGKKLDASLFSPSALDKGINDEIFLGLLISLNALASTSATFLLTNDFLIMMALKLLMIEVLQLVRT